ncbi:hypothetical protein G0U57_003575, partial [Chelydra serpentina]
PFDGTLDEGQPPPYSVDSECEDAFQELKASLCREPVLYSPDFHREFILQTDASEVGLGAVLSQEVDGEEHPVLYLSRKLFPCERNYAVIEKEALAVKWACDALRYYLLGAPFLLVTNHAALQWLPKMKNNMRLTRWYRTLLPYAFTVRHRAGKDHVNADFFSRLGDLDWSGPDEREPALRSGVCSEAGWRPT